MDLEFEEQIFASLISDMADVLLISEKEINEKLKELANKILI